MTAAASRIPDFDTWRPGYQSAVVQVFAAGTTALAPLWFDQAMTQPAPNPQICIRLDIAGGVGNGGTSFGKFAQPVYCGVGYNMIINGTDQTGVERPKLSSVAFEIADLMQAKTARGTAYRRLTDRFDNVVHALDFGVLSPLSSATNSATIIAAIGAASGQGGGAVKIPPGTYLVTSPINLPANVVLEGDSKAACTLQCADGANVFVIQGDAAGFRRITLDGLQLQANSQGVYGKGVNAIVFDDVVVKRFANGIHFDGSRRNRWKLLEIDNCVNGAVLHGDTLANAGGGGDEFTDNEWQGRVTTCTGIGVELAFKDTFCRETRLSLDFDSNTGTALKINGARNTILETCWFTGNTADILFADGSDQTKALFNTVIGFEMRHGGITGGSVTFNGIAQNIRFRRCDFSSVAFQNTFPQHEIVFEDCTEDSGVTISGDGTKIARVTANNLATSSGITTDNNPTAAYNLNLAPGQVAQLRVRAIGNQQNGTNRAVLERLFRVKLPGSTFLYQGNTSRFTLGDILTGLTSGAKARITADANTGVTGTLTVRAVVGTFIAGESLQDQHTGVGVANGLPALAAAAVTSSVTIGTDDVDGSAGSGSSGWGCTCVANGQQAQVMVTGATSMNVEWTVNVDIASSL